MVLKERDSSSFFCIPLVTFPVCLLHLQLIFLSKILPLWSIFFEVGQLLHPLGALPLPSCQNNIIWSYTIWEKGKYSSSNSMEGRLLTENLLESKRFYFFRNPEKKNWTFFSRKSCDFWTRKISMILKEFPHNFEKF